MDWILTYIYHKKVKVKIFIFTGFFNLLALRMHIKCLEICEKSKHISLILKFAINVFNTYN